ncbi:MAG: PQQ-binding-like beta-propeller repeat protein [Planctomycetes bacterium]|nr:PQQ-binding-like beta-propeller repeat protein [Planctomycetota bacterium]
MFRRIALASLLVSPAFASDWSNLGGNGARNGLSSEHGPTTGAVLWSNALDPAVIAWHPVTLGHRVFAIREAGFPQNGGAANDKLVCYDIDSGAILWSTVVPYSGSTATDWIAWIGGANGSRVYASRASNGKPKELEAFDAATGAHLWTSVAKSEAFAYDGVVFAPDGDPIVGDLSTLTRIDAATGTTVWTFNRTRPISGNCGAAVTDTAVYLDNGFFGSSQWITKLDLATGAFLYDSPHIPGGSEQNAPFVSPDGKTVYLARTQNNPATDFLFAFDDTGSALNVKWQTAVRWTTSHEHGIAADGSIYTFLPNNEFVRLDPATGLVASTAGILSPIGTGNLSPKTAVAANGVVYVSNGWANSPSTNGRVWAFSADLSTNLFTLNLTNPNQGGPALGANGTLIVADLAGVRAYRTPTASFYCAAKTNSLGCVPGITFTGAASATSSDAFTIREHSVLNNKNGLFFYGTAGAASSPFQGGTLCVHAPIKRTSVQNSGGNPPPNDCSGSYAIDFNSLIQGGTDPNLVSGAAVHGQWWARDPSDPFTTSLSGGITFTIQP